MNKYINSYIITKKIEPEQPEIIGKIIFRLYPELMKYLLYKRVID
jgi:hypothetical protein